MRQNRHNIGMSQDLFSLVRHNRYKAVCEMVEKAVANDAFDPGQRDAFGNTLLLTSCQNGLKGMAKLMLRHGADIDATNDKGNSALHFCALFGYSPSRRYPFPLFDYRFFSVIKLLGLVGGVPDFQRM